MFSRRAILRSLLALPLASLFVKKTEAKEGLHLPTLDYARKFFDDHVPTGIPELDNALGGGFPRGKVTSVTIVREQDYELGRLDDVFAERGAVVFGGEYGGHYVNTEYNNETVEEVYKACDAALQDKKAVVFITSRKPMICKNLYNRLADVYVVFDTVEQFSVLTVNRKF